MPRKYASKKKTTTPEGYKEYKKLQMRDRRAEKRKEIEELLAKVKAIPEFQQLSEAEQKILAKAIVKQYMEFDRALAALMREFDIKLEEVAQRINAEREQFLKVLLSQYVTRVNDIKRAALMTTEAKLEQEKKHERRKI